MPSKLRDDDFKTRVPWLVKQLIKHEPNIEIFQTYKALLLIVF